MSNQEKEGEELFQAEADITKLETMSDGGIRLVVDTQEITDDQELAKLFRLKKGAHGFFLFKSSKIKQEDVPEYEPSESENSERTPSQRLRAVLFVYWKQVKGGTGDFDAYYRMVLNQLIDNYKEKLPPKSGD